MRSWLEQDTSCPTCRKSLQDEKDIQNQAAAAGINLNNANAPIDLQNNQQQQPQQQQLPQLLQQRFVRRNLFHFDGSRYISWLPSFSLQVTNSTGTLPSLLGRREVLDPQRLTDMVGFSKL